MKKFTQFSRGFTLIELLVVIAIIGILSSIVLASLSTARSKANDSKIQEQLSGMRSAAEIFSATNNGYNTAAGTAANCTTANTVFTDTTSGALAIYTGVASTSGVGAIACVASSSAWAMSAGLPSAPTTSFWCVDSTGKSKTEPTGSVTSLCQ